MAWPTKKAANNTADKLKRGPSQFAMTKGETDVKRADGTLGPRSITKVLVKEVLVGDSRRKADLEQVKMMADSMARVGLINPITITTMQRQTANENGTVSIAIKLVAGLHRLEAAKLLKWKSIDALVVAGNRTDNRLREIAENLFRNELTVLERAELVAEWAELSGQEAGQVGQPGGRQPNDKGISKAAKALNLSRKDVSRSKRMADISAEAKEAAKAAHLDDVQMDLLDIAKQATPKEQVKKVREIAKRKKKGRRKMGKKSSATKPKALAKLKSQSGEDDEILASLTSLDPRKPKAYFAAIKSVWVNTGLAEAWVEAPRQVRKRFIAEVLS